MPDSVLSGQRVLKESPSPCRVPPIPTVWYCTVPQQGLTETHAESVDSQSGTRGIPLPLRRSHHEDKKFNNLFIPRQQQYSTLLTLGTLEYQIYVTSITFVWPEGQSYNSLP